MDQHPSMATCLRELIEHPLVASRARVYSYNEDFKTLWSSDFQPRDAQGVTQRTIVVFDSVPDSTAEQHGLNLADRVTAYDWVAWLALRKQGGFSVMLLDLASHRHPGAFAVQTLPLLLPDLPWVRLYKLREPSDEESSHAGIVKLLTGRSDNGWLAAQLGRDGFNEFRLFCDLGLAGGHPAIALPPREVLQGLEGTLDPAGERIKELWTQSLTRAGGRHEVANLIGPLFLADAMVSKGYYGAAELLKRLQKDKLVGALCCLLTAVGLLCAPDEKPDKSELPEVLANPRHFPATDAFGRFPNVKFLLVDDQARLGYARLLSVFLTGEQGSEWESSEASWNFNRPRVSIRAETNPDFLVGLLEIATASEEEWKKLRVLGKDQFDVLFLDLRLFPESGGNQISPEETKFLQRLTAVYRKAVPARARAEGSWDERPKSPLERAYEAAEERLRGQAETPLQWTLLPLLLCEADPSLPIIVFSSTHQRDIIDALSTKPNVITSFAKPVLSGYRENARERVCDDLTDALRRALELHEKRVVWQRFVFLQDWSPHPIFKIHLGKGPDKTYNGQGGLPFPPRIPNEELRRILASHFREYLLHGRYFDLLSAPIELLEAALVPEEHVSGVEKVHPTVIFARDDEGYPLVTALKSIRNKKAHGHAGFDESGTWFGWNARGQLVAVILLFLADFIDSKTIGEPCKAVQEKWDGYCLQMAWNLLKNLRRDSNSTGEETFRDKGIDPRHLTTNRRIDWRDITMYTLGMGCREAALHHCPSSTGSWKALETLIVSRLEDLKLGLAVGRLGGCQRTKGQPVEIKTDGGSVWRRVGFFGEDSKEDELVVFKPHGEEGSPDGDWALCESWLPNP